MSISISVAYVAEIERLRHDIERHIAIASNLATENERLRAELAEYQRCVEQVQGQADRAYCNYIERLRREECLGWENKLKRGLFGDAELKAHCAAAEQLGRHRALSEVAAAALPGVYYMDPPDGGDVSVSEQLRRMAKDAERYRLLRRKFAIISDLEGHAKFCAINLPRPTYIAPSSAIELDTALDRECLGLDGARPSTPV